MGTLRGFGMTFDLDTGSMRSWYVDREGVKRWVDNEQPVDPQSTAPRARGDE